MFEKEAEEYADKEFGMYQPTDHERYLCESSFKYGAEYAYRKKCEETFELALLQIKHYREVVIEQNEKLLAENDDLKKSIKKASEWHYPSEGELPKEGVNVLVYSDDGVFNVCRRKGNIGECECQWECDTSDLVMLNDCDITAWQYLPERPKEEVQE